MEMYSLQWFLAKQAKADAARAAREAQRKPFTLFAADVAETVQRTGRLTPRQEYVLTCAGYSLLPKDRIEREGK